MSQGKEASFQKSPGWPPRLREDAQLSSLLPTGHAGHWKAKSHSWVGEHTENSRTKWKESRVQPRPGQASKGADQLSRSKLTQA